MARMYSTAGRRILETKTLPAGAEKGALFFVPRGLGFESVLGVAYVVRGKLTVAFYTGVPKRWDVRTLSTAARSVTSVATGVQSNDYRWIAIQTRERKVVLLSLGADLSITESLSSNVTPASGESLLGSKPLKLK